MIYRELLEAEGRLLVFAARADLGDAERAQLAALYDELGAEAARRAAVRNQVEALAGLGLMKAGVRIPAGWREAVERNGQRVEALVEALSRVVGRLASTGVASAAIEAGGVLLGSDLDVRGYCPGDIDLLVDADGWERVAAAFEAEGFSATERRGCSTRRVEFRRQHPDVGEQWLEAGCEPFDRRWVPLAVRDCSQEWLRHRVAARKGRGLSVLDPSEALALVAIHTSLHSYVRAPGLRLHLDADRLVRDNALDWERFIGAVRDARAGRRALVSLAMAQGLLGTPVPPSVMQRLSPGDRDSRRLHALLSSEGVIASGRRKLGRLKTLLLDLLLTEDGARAWARSAIFPPEAWMRRHFEAGGRRAPRWRLHARRFRRLLTVWEPQ